MSPPDPKLWLFLNETLPAEEGLSLLGALVADVQYPTNRYEPKNATQPRQRPFLKPGDLLEPYVEDRTITAETHSGSTFDTGLASFISGNTNSSNSRRAELISTCITTYNLRSPDDVFKRIRNDAKYWQRVEELMRTSDTKKLYFVRGYKTAIDPIVILHTSNQRSHGGELMLPLIEAATGGLNLPAGIIIGDPRLAASFERGSTASQCGLVKGERLFAIQYWALVKKREPRQKSKQKFFNWPKSKRTDGIQARPPPGKHIMFHGDEDPEKEDDEDPEKEDDEDPEKEDDEDEDEDEDEDDDDDSDEEDRDEWSIMECSIDAFD